MSPRRPVYMHALLFALAGLLTTGCAYEQKISVLGRFPTPLKEVTVKGAPGARNKVALVEVEGLISLDKAGFCVGSCPAPATPAVLARLAKIEADPDIKAVIIRFDTPGGDATASDILYNEIKEFKQRTGLPVIGYMERLCASGGVYAAMAADVIIAHPVTITGSIGVIFQRANVQGLLGKIGVTMPVIVSGPHKDMGSPFRESTPEEVEMFRTIVMGMYDRFVDTVAEGRSLPRETVQTFADGRIFSAKEALDLKLIDRLGDLDDAWKESVQRGKIAGADAARMITWRSEETYDETPYGPASSRIDQTDPMTFWSSRLLSVMNPGVYYLWPAWMSDGAGK